MIIAAEYSFNGGDSIKETHSHLIEEVVDIIGSVDALRYKTKKSKEKTMPGRMLYSPKGLNKGYSKGFNNKGWEEKIRVNCEYSRDYYCDGYSPRRLSQNAYREMDFLKGSVGVEVQFGKYAFMVYNVCAKMTIFSNLGIIDVGIEIVPVQSMAAEMSSGVSYFEQFVWDLENRGVSDIDIPVLIYGVDVGNNTNNTNLEVAQQLSLDFDGNT